jgi:hypothetical protein
LNGQEVVGSIESSLNLSCENNGRQSRENHLKANGTQQENMAGEYYQPYAAERTIKELQRTIDQLNSEKASLLNELASSRQNLNQLESENISLHNELDSCKQNLEDQIQCWNSVKRQQDVGLSLFRQQKANMTLRKELIESQRVAKFIQNPNGNVFPRPPSDGQIQNDFDYIRSRSKITFQFNDELVPRIPENFDLAFDTEQLLRRVFHGEQGSDIPLKMILNRARCIEPQILVRTMITAALQGWVFESDWPNFNRINLRLLHMYRMYLRKQEGR